MDLRGRLGGDHAADQGTLDFDGRALVAEAFAGPVEPDEFDGLADAGEGSFELDSVESLDCAGGAGTEADHDSACGELVDGAEALGQGRGRAREDVDDGG